MKFNKSSIILSLGVLALTVSGITNAQTYSSEPLYRDSKGNLYISNGASGVTPIYPVDNYNNYNYVPPTVVQTIPSYTYTVPAPAPVYRDPVYDVAPWLLLGGAAIAISNSHRHYGPRYDYRPYYHSRPPRHGHRWNR